MGPLSAHVRDSEVNEVGHDDRHHRVDRAVVAVHSSVAVRILDHAQALIGPSSIEQWIFFLHLVSIFKSPFKLL